MKRAAQAIKDSKRHIAAKEHENNWAAHKPRIKYLELQSVIY